jgi:hypothetical protein
MEHRHFSRPSVFVRFETTRVVLCETYWYPLYAYVRRRVPDVNEAQDLTQAFMTSKADLVSGRGIDEDGAVIVWMADELDRRLPESIRAERFAQEYSE